MASTRNNRFNFTAFAIAATAFFALHASMLMGFEQLTSNSHSGIDQANTLAKSNVAPRTITLERVVISTRRV